MNDPQDLPEAPAPGAENLTTVPLAGTPPAAPADLAPADLAPAACAARLAELFPAVFSPGTAKPLKLRIQADVQQRAPGLFTKKALSIFLQRHTTSTAYLKALAREAERIDLDGLPAGPVSDEHRQAAIAELQRRRAVHDERRAAERAAQRKAQDDERREREAEGQARSARAGLLRAFETTTLTRANFCALKGLSDAELDAALAQARQERERQLQVPRPQQAHAGKPAERERRGGQDRQPGGRPRSAGKPAR